MKYLLTISFIALSVSFMMGQCVFDAERGVWRGQTPEDPCVNVLATAMPFLTISPDARGSGMGDVGIATSPDVNKMHYNPSMLAFSEKKGGLGLNYTPWLRDLGLNDVFLGYVNGFYKPNDQQAFGVALRYFSYGTINFTDNQGGSLGTGEPYEMEFGLNYARKLSDYLSASIGGKYIYSNLAAGQQVGLVSIEAASSVAADISLTYRNEMSSGNIMTIATNIKNIGSKVNYTPSNELSIDNHIPTNFGLGFNYESIIDDYNRFSVGLDLNKLLVPSPRFEDDPEFDTDGNDIPDFREQSIIGSIFSSWGDAPNGISEELSEFTVGLGGEYWYNDQFAVRGGYFYEAPSKGNRQYLTLGLGVKYNVFNLDFSYLVATNGVQNPLNNTFRFSLLFDLDVLTYEGDE